MARKMLLDEHWFKLKEIMHQFGIYDKGNLRKNVESIYTLQVLVALGEIFLKNSAPGKLIYRLSLKGKLMLIFKELVKNPDLEWSFIDGSFIKAHEHSTGAASEENQAIGESIGGNTTKIRPWFIFSFWNNWW